MDRPKLLKCAVLDEFNILDEAAEALEMNRTHLSRVLNEKNHIKTAVKIYFKLKELRGQPRYGLEEILEEYL